MARLAWPALCENLLATLVQFCDTAMVGMLGAAATASIAVSSSPMWLMVGLVTAIGVGGTALVARRVGAEDMQGARDVCRQVFIAILALSSAIMIVALVLAPFIPRWMNAEEAIHAEATAYLRIVALGFIPRFTGMMLGSAMRGAGDTRTPMRIAALANLLNIIGNFLLIFETRVIALGPVSFTMWGAGLGVRGAAIATALSTGFSGLAMLWLITRKQRVFRLELTRLRPDFSLMRRIFSVGIPAALERVTINVGQVIYVALVSSLGTAQLAAHHLSITVESLSYMPGFAFGVAATTLVGQALGAEEPDRASAQGRLCIRAGVVVMSLVGVVMFLFAPQLIALLAPDAAVREIGAGLIRIAALEQPFMAMNMVAASGLRGAGDTRVPFYVSAVGMWGVRLVLALLFVNVLGWGINGAWYAMVADQGIRGVLMTIRFARGKWKATKI